MSFINIIYFLFWRNNDCFLIFEETMWFYDDVVCHMMYPAYSFDFPEDLELIKKIKTMRLYSEKVLNGFTFILLFLLAKWIFQFLWISTGNTWKVKTIFQSGNKPRFVLITTNINSISHCYHELISCQFKSKIWATKWSELLGYLWLNQS